jgi:hypothetical protein
MHTWLTTRSAVASPMLRYTCRTMLPRAASASIPPEVQTAMRRHFAALGGNACAARAASLGLSAEVHTSTKVACERSDIALHACHNGPCGVGTSRSPPQTCGNVLISSVSE